MYFLHASICLKDVVHSMVMNVYHIAIAIGGQILTFPCYHGNIVGFKIGTRGPCNGVYKIVGPWWSGAFL